MRWRREDGESGEPLSTEALKARRVESWREAPADVEGNLFCPERGHSSRVGVSYAEATQKLEEMGLQRR
eukprot:385991-Prymnesium_polylepis.1